MSSVDVAPSCSHFKTTMKVISWRGVAAVDSFLGILIISEIASNFGWSTASIASGFIVFEAMTKFAWMYGWDRCWQTKIINRFCDWLEVSLKGVRNGRLFVR